MGECQSGEELHSRFGILELLDEWFPSGAIARLAEQLGRMGSDLKFGVGEQRESRF